MSERSESTRHWLTMTFVSLAAVVIPVLIYSVFVYRTQSDYQVAHSERAVAEIEGEISTRLKQLKPLLQRTPYASIGPKLQYLRKTLVSKPTLDEPCGSAKASQSAGASSSSVSNNASPGASSSPLFAASDCLFWTAAETEFLDACKTFKKRNAEDWEKLDLKWEQLRAAGESCATSLHQKLTVVDDTFAKYMDALRQSPGFDRLDLAYGKTGGCQHLGIGESSYRNVLVSGTETRVRVVNCAHALALDLDLVGGGASAEYAELPLRDIVEIAARDQNFAGLWLFDSNDNVLFSAGTGAAGGLSSIDLASLLEPESGATKGPDQSTAKRSPSTVLPAFRSGVDIGGSLYELFVQRVSIPFSDGDGNSRTLYLGAAIPSSTFRASVMQVRVTVLATILAALILVICFLPYLRIMFIGPLEEIRTYDLLGLMMGVVTAAGVFVIATLSILSYRSERIRLHDATVQTADSMQVAFETELRSSIGMLAKRREDLLERQAMSKAAPGEEQPVHCIIEESGFEFAMLLDRDGQFLQTDSCRRSKVITAKVPDRVYFRRVADGRGWDIDQNGNEHFFLERIRALDHGNLNTVLSIAVPPPLIQTVGQNSSAPQPIVAAMGRQLQVFSQRLLPPDVDFAVIEDATGRVLYHSIESRSLVEKFYEETRESHRLATAVAARRRYDGDFIYRGLHVTGTSRPLSNVPWSLIVFADKNLAATACFSAGVDAVAMFGVYGFLLFAGLVVTRMIVGERPWAWAWPEAKRGRVQTFAAVAVGMIAGAELLTGLGANPHATPILVATSVVAILSILFVRLDPHQDRFLGRHNFTWGCLLVAVAIFAAAGFRWGDGLDVVFSVGVLLMVLAWAYFRRDEDQSWTHPVVSRCFPYAACASIMAIALGAPPAVLFFRDAWEQSAGRLALIRAEQTTHNARALDRALENESRRVNGIHGVIAASTLKPAGNAWRGNAQALLNGRPVLQDERKKPVAITSGPTDAARMRCEDPHAAGSLAEWKNYSLQGWFSRLSNLFPITFSLASTRLKYEATTTNEHEGWGWADRTGGRFGWCLPADDGMFRYAAVSSAAFFPDWRDNDPVAAAATMAVLLALGACLIWMMEPLIRRVFVLDLIPPMGLLWPEAIDIGGAKRLILIDPPEQQLQALMQPVSSKWCCVRAAELLRRDRDSKIKECLEPRYTPEDGLTGLKPLMIRDVELLLVDPDARLRLLEVLEEASRVTDRIIVLVADVPPYEWLATQNEQQSVPAVTAAKKGAEILGDSQDGPVIIHSRTGITTGELLRWSSLLLAFEIRNYRSPDVTLICEETPEPGKPKPTETETQQRIVAWCSWAQELQPIARHLCSRASLTVAQADRELSFRAEPFYRKQWSLCSTAERLALLHLAEGKLPNPRNLGALQSLWRKGMIRKSPELEIVSSNFAAFVRSAEPPERLAALRRATGGGRWSVIRTPLLLTLATIIAFVAYVSRDAVDNTVALLGAVMTVVPLVTRVIGFVGARAAADSSDMKVA